MKWKENRWIRRFFHSTSKSRSDMLNHTGGTFFAQNYDGLSENFCLGIESWKISWLYRISKLENQLQDWRLSQNRRSSDHNVLDQRSSDYEINRRTCDIAIGCGATRCPWFRYAWYDDYVCIEETSQHADTFPKEGKCRRAACSEVWSIIDRRTNYAHDLWTFPCYRSLWSSKRLVHFEFIEWRRPRFRRSMTSYTIISEWNTSDMIPEELYKSKLQDSVQLQVVLTLYDQETARNKGKSNYSQIEDSCKTSYFTDDKNSKTSGFGAMLWKEDQ